MKRSGFAPWGRSGFRVAVLAPMLVLVGVATAFGGKPKRCDDVPVSVTFTAPGAGTAAIENDNPAVAYVDGVDGVGAVIHFNLSCDGTRDMTLDLGGSARTLRVQVPDPIPGSTSNPVPAGTLTTQAFFNVRNILAKGITPTPSVFYTKVTSPFPGAGRNDPSYRLTMFPDNVTCPGGGSPDPCAPLGDGPNEDRNSPGQTAWTKVTYTPASGGNPDTWIIDGDLTTNEDGEPPLPIQRGTIYSVDKHGNLTHRGQYSLPFRMVITALAPLPQP
jgi:hypothetical protein